MGVLLELLRIVMLMMLMGAGMAALLHQLYASLGFDSVNGWLLGIAVYLWLFILYRNKWQFSGWYKGKSRQKLPRNLVIGLMICSIILVVLAPIAG
ncbi:hypothetical protein EDM59_24435 [Brevibacillus nitrificans]|uniref:DUF4181 domain-containing protein n=1 Tax=Brevibacillus nitrificans TaxID=651560 RepID=A0A3M8CXI7_9BACL|nr:hypothetical protein [Brevibacillus nitrificans]RNB80484.1 hypothetical protein EDM59_24435 [Brevibacillus nitrificans]